MMDGCDNDMEDVALVEGGAEHENPEKIIYKFKKFFLKISVMLNFLICKIREW